jgi:NAD(P)H-hydrate epimerase
VIPLVAAREMRHAEDRAVRALGVSTLLLMENAGRGAAQAVERALGGVTGRRVAVVCGKGQNGGDGFVVARHLACRGAAVTCWLAGQAAQVRGDAATNLETIMRLGLPVTELRDAADLGALRRALADADLLVDGLLGTGVRGAATGIVADAIAALNASGRPVCALDLPSGIDADRGVVPGPAVRASFTVTFGLPKLALYQSPAAEHAGRVEVADIGIPRDWLREGVGVALVEAADVRAALPGRPVDAHKGRYGHLLVVAGSVGKTGAAVLACRGALRSGTGLVTAALPASQQPVVAAALAEAMTEPLAETAAQTLSTKALDRLLELAGRADAVVVGPGAGLDAETAEILRALIAGTERPVVVDADALTALAGHLDAARTARGPRLLTPHPGEAARLLGQSAADVQADRIGSVRALAEASGALVALKGAGTLVTRSGGMVTVNPTGNPGMATGGMGDVLAGVAGGFLAQGLDPESALRAAVYLHGLAGDLVAARLGGVGLLAGDLAEALPDAIRQVRAPAPA